jgi:hypothetical protein
MATEREQARWVVVTGASSGIGEAIGYTRFHTDCGEATPSHFDSLPHTLLQLP